MVELGSISFSQISWEIGNIMVSSNNFEMLVNVSGKLDLIEKIGL